MVRKKFFWVKMLEKYKRNGKKMDIKIVNKLNKKGWSIQLSIKQVIIDCNGANKKV